MSDDGNGEDDDVHTGLRIYQLLSDILAVLDSNQGIKAQNNHIPH